MISRLLPLLFAAPVFLLHAAETTGSSPANGAAKYVLAIPGLITFWDFQEAAGAARKGRGPHPMELREVMGKVDRAEGGVFGPYAAHIHSGRFLRAPREELGPLDIHGPEARVTLAAWVKRDSDRFWQSIAGVWDETHKKRQYMLFLNARARTDPATMERENCRDLVHGHISSVGGPTPGHQVCKTYASGGTPVSFERWHLLAMTYDGKHIRVYLDGKLDEEVPFNPFPYPEGIYDGGEDGAPFTVGANHVAGIENNNPFGGRIGGVAVFDRALSDEEIASLAEATLARE